MFRDDKDRERFLSPGGGSGFSEKEVRSGNHSRRTPKVRANIACLLNREVGIPKAEIATRLEWGL